VQPEEGKEYAALLVGRAQDFVDINNPADVYPAAMWERFNRYLRELPVEEMSLPGGRYACAQVLLARRLPFFEGRTLGEVCHILQVAMSQRKMLGYVEGCIVPFGRSLECAKEQCASQRQPMAPGRPQGPALRLAAWADVRVRLWELLGDSDRDGAVTLSNVKRLFHSRFGMELSETALGHSRLSELLQDPRLSDICGLELRGKVHFVVQRAPPPAVALATAPAAWASAALEGRYEELLELSLDEGRGALRALSGYRAMLPEPAAKGGDSRSSSASMSRSTSDGTAGRSDDDTWDCHVRVRGAWSPPPGLAPPPGLKAL